MAQEDSNKPTGSFSLFTKSKDLVLANINTYVVIFLVPFLFGLFSNIRNRHTSLFMRTGNTAPTFDFSAMTLGLGVVVGLVLLVIYVYVIIAAYALNLESAKGKKPTVSELMPLVQKYGVRFIGLAIATTFMIFIGFIALIVPGFIFIRRYFLAPYVMIDQDLSIGAAMKESARISKPHSGSVWGLVGVTLVLSLPSIVPVFGWVVSFALTSLYAVAPALRYQELKKLAPAAK